MQPGAQASVDCVDHRRLDARQPLVHRTARLDRLWRRVGVDERQALALGGAHRPRLHQRRRARRLRLVDKLEPLDGVEALGQVRLHCVRVARVAEDLEQLVVGQEKEAREGSALHLQIGLEPLLDALQRRHPLLQRFEHLRERVADDERVGVHLPHQLAPGLVGGGEGAKLLRQLSLHVCRSEDALQIHPALLQRQPDLEHLRQQAEPLPPPLRLRQQRRDVPRPHHRLHHQLGLLEHREGLLDVAQDVAVLGVLVRPHLELGLAPAALHALEHRTQRLLLRSLDADGAQLLVVLVHLQPQQVAERTELVAHHRAPKHAGDPLPVARLEVRVAQRAHRRHHRVVLRQQSAQPRQHRVRRQASLAHRSHLRVPRHLLRHLIGVDLLEVRREPFGRGAFEAVDALPEPRLDAQRLLQRPQLVVLGGQKLERLLIGNVGRALRREPVGARLGLAEEIERHRNVGGAVVEHLHLGGEALTIGGGAQLGHKRVDALRPLQHLLLMRRLVRRDLRTELDEERLERELPCAVDVGQRDLGRVHQVVHALHVVPLAAQLGLQRTHLAQEGGERDEPLDVGRRLGEARRRRRRLLHRLLRALARHARQQRVHRVQAALRRGQQRRPQPRRVRAEDADARGGRQLPEGHELRCVVVEAAAERGERRARPLAQQCGRVKGDVAAVRGHQRREGARVRGDAVEVRRERHPKRRRRLHAAHAVVHERAQPRRAARRAGGGGGSRRLVRRGRRLGVLLCVGHRDRDLVGLAHILPKALVGAHRRGRTDRRDRALEPPLVDERVPLGRSGRLAQLSRALVERQLHREEEPRALAAARRRCQLRRRAWTTSSVVVVAPAVGLARRRVRRRMPPTTRRPRSRRAHRSTVGVERLHHRRHRVVLRRGGRTMRDHARRPPLQPTTVVASRGSRLRRDARSHVGARRRPFGRVQASVVCGGGADV